MGDRYINNPMALNMEDHANRSVNQTKLFNLIGHIPKWKHLAELPDEVCKVLCEMAISLKGGGYLAITAKVNFEKLSTLSTERVLAGFEEFKKTSLLTINNSRGNV